MDRCSCSEEKCDCGKPVSRKKVKLIICLIILLIAAGIITYRIIRANNNSTIVSNGIINFTFGQPVSDITLPSGSTVKAERNLGEYIRSLNELNLVAIDNDSVFVFIPDSENALPDDTTRDILFEVQQDFKRRSDTMIGLYTLWYDSEDYSEIAKQVELPAIVVARKDKGTVIIPGCNVTEYMLLQAYLDAATGDCCDIILPNCC